MNRMGNPVPDAVSISGDVDIWAGGGSSVSLGGYLLMINGARPGSSTGFSDAGLGVPGASATVVFTKWYYIGGEIDNLFG